VELKARVVGLWEGLRKESRKENPVSPADH